MNRALWKAQTVKGKWVTGYLCKRSYGYCIEYPLTNGITVIGVIKDTAVQCTSIPSNDDLNPLIFEGDTVRREASIPGGINFTGIVTWLEGGWCLVDDEYSVDLWSECDYLFIEGD